MTKEEAEEIRVKHSLAIGLMEIKIILEKYPDFVWSKKNLRSYFKKHRKHIM